MSTVTSLGFSIFSRYKGSGTRQASKDLDSFSSKLQSAGSKTMAVGAGMTAGLTAPIVGVGAAVLTLGGDFEQSMNRVQAVSGASASEFSDLRDMAKQLGATTMFSASQAAEGMNFLAMAGFSATETMEALPGVLDLAAAGAVDLGVAADIASNILSGYGMEASEIGRLNDVLAKTFTSTNVDLNMLGESFKYVAPVAASAGLRFEEMSAAVGMLGNVGIQGSEAGTALRGAIGRLLSPTTEVADTLDKLGVSVLDSSGDLLSLADIIGQLEKSGASTADMLTIFGLEAGPAMQGLLSQGSDALRELTGELEGSAGHAADIAAVSMEGFNGGVLELKSALEGLAIEIAESGLMEWATKLVGVITEWVQGLSQSNPMMFKLGVIIGLVLAVLGPIVMAVGAFIAAIGAIGAVMTPVVGVVALVIAGIVALGVAIWAAWKHSDSFRAGVTAAWEAIKAGWSALWDGVLKPGLDALMAWWSATWPKIKETALAAWAAVMATFEEIKPKLMAVFSSVMEIVNWLIRDIQIGWSQHSGWIIGTLLTLWDFVSGIFRGAVTLVVSIVRGLWQAVSGIFSGAISVIGGILDVIIGVLTGNWQRAGEGVLGIVQGLWTAVSGVFSGAVTILGGILKALYQAIIQPIINLHQRIVGNSIIPDLVAGVISWFTRLRDMAARIFNAVRDWIIARVMTLYKRVITTIANLVAGFITRITSLRDRVRALWNTLVNWLISRANTLRDRIVSAVNTLRDRTISAFDRARAGIKKVWDKVQDVAKKPIRFVIQTVFNKGIVGVWNKVADKVPGISSIKTMKLPAGFARGGILPGRSSWRGGDTHLRPMREGEGVYVSEAMRDPYERARLHAVNKAAMSGQSLDQFRDVPLARSASDVARGQPPLDGYAEGGIVGRWLSSKWDSIVGKVKDWATKPLNALRDNLRDKFGTGQDFEGIPHRALAAWREKILDRFGKADDAHAASMAGGADSWVGLESASARLRRAATWARAQHGKPYVWGGAGPGGYDCSGFTGAIENKLRGVGPHFRRYSTHAFRGNSAPAGWVRNLASPYQVGITHAGVGHTSGSLMGVNVESRGGGAGVLIGSRARGARDRLYSATYGFAPVAGDATTTPANAALFDNGGTLAPGLNLVDNRLGKPEPLRNLDKIAAPTVHVQAPEVRVYIGDEEITGRVRVVVKEEQRKARAEDTHRAKHGRR